MTTKANTQEVAVKHWSDSLKSIRACSEAVEWAESQPDFQTAWARCERADWMLWLAGTMEGKKGWPNRKAIVLAACAIAETVLHLVPEGEERPRIAIETARRWVGGEATIQEVRKAADAASAYADDADDADADDAAAADAAYAADYAASAADAADYAAYAADAADYADYAADAIATSLKNSAEIVRQHITPGEL